jgi:hypothetical protein
MRVSKVPRVQKAKPEVKEKIRTRSKDKACSQNPAYHNKKSPDFFGKKPGEILEELTGKIIGAAIAVHRKIGQVFWRAFMKERYVPLWLDCLILGQK